MKKLLYSILILFLMFPETTQAAQVHGDSEGIYARQLAHLFFMLSMMILIYWLRQRKLIKVIGWKYIQYAAFFFILWNINVMLVHFLNEQALIITVERISTWRILVTSSMGRWLEIVYFAARLDHLICVPALLFLFLGLRKLVQEETEKSSGNVIR
jgi:hypothetical protein